MLQVKVSEVVQGSLRGRASNGCSVWMVTMAVAEKVIEGEVLILMSTRRTVVNDRNIQQGVG